MKPKTIAALAFALGIGFAGGYFVRDSYKPEKISLEKTVKTYTVDRFVDGDTIDLENGIEVLLKRIRLLGINTPERGKPLYKEATIALENLIANKDITLEKDPSKNQGKYGRPLRYILVDNKNLNIEMVRLGYAKAFMYEGLKYEKEILKAQEKAKAAKRGLWANR